MTGYGRGEAHHDGLKFTVELNSVNRRQADIVLDLPREMIELEPRIRDEINAAVSRGRLNVVVTFHRADGTKASEVRLDEPLAKAYMRAIGKLRKDLKLNGSITTDALLRCPGVLKLNEPEIDPEKIWPHVEKALKKALAGLIKMRSKEGLHLRQDLLNRIDHLSKGVEKIQKLSPVMMERYREQLHDRIRHSGLEISMDDERLMKEIAFFADRSDITEELTRLASHLSQYRDNLNSSEPVGRTLDFLSQEINREINTIGSKANHAEISQTVVSMKSELEKIREQIQNVE
jgi:uncharacterized protein (TIGR00255 family)